jgi:hypothetical protein
MDPSTPPPLTLQVPEPPARPGDQPDFSYLKLAPAGSARPAGGGFVAGAAA